MSSTFRYVALLRGPLASRITCRTYSQRISTCARPQKTIAPYHANSQRRAFTISRILRDAHETNKRNPDEDVKDGENSQDKFVATGTALRKVHDRPWQRESSNAGPESTSPDPSGGDPSKGRLLTTPTRLLKLILPMPFHPDQTYINLNAEDKKRWKLGKVEPLAILVHPQQPLSYLERLIQAEVPPVLVDGKEKLPDVIFRAEADRSEGPESNSGSDSDSTDSPSNVASYSGLGREGPERKESQFMRWGGSVELGDFIRDAARGKEFAVQIEGLDQELRIAVPSFWDRTHYMRTSLRRMSKQIEQMSSIKNECDNIAHRGAHRLAQGGFAALAGWFGTVYFTTFHTEAGWDLVEPVTYLVSLGAVMFAYLWFLYMSRDLSYRAAMNLTVSKRQNALYQDRGFDIRRWEQLVQDANLLRRDIKVIAAEYDADWDETRDLGGHEVKKLLEKEKSGQKKKKKEDEEANDEEDKDDDDDKEGHHGKEEGKEGNGHKASQHKDS